MLFWKTGDLHIVALDKKSHARAKYNLLRNDQCEKIHFILNCTPSLMLTELISPTVFENDKSDYFISENRYPLTDLIWTMDDQTVIKIQRKFVIEQTTSKKRKFGQNNNSKGFTVKEVLLANDQEICNECFLQGTINEKDECHNHKEIEMKEEQPLKKKTGKGCECGAVKKPIFGDKNTKTAKYCLKCKKVDSVNVRNKLCACNTSQPTYGKKGAKTAYWCKLCCPLDSVDIRHKLCPCGVRPSFGKKGTKKGIYCKNCKIEGSIDVTAKYCECNFTIATFGKPGTKTALYCANCPSKPYDAVDVRHKVCACGTRMSFGFVGQKKALFCQNCKPEEAVNVVSRKCECELSSPSFGIEGKTKRKWCKHCPTLPPDAVILNYRKLCLCKSVCPSFKIIGMYDVLFCVKCKPENSEHIYHVKCQCGTIASYGLLGDDIPKWCFKCSPEEAVDVVRKKCEKCSTRIKLYNFPGQTPVFCGICKEKGMIYRSTKKCCSLKCRGFAIYGPSLNLRLRCDAHKLENDFNLVEKDCVSCGLPNILDKNNKCQYCDETNFKNFLKRKEFIIKDFLVANKMGDFIQNKVANGSDCGLERVDFFWDLKTHIVILEVDEDQHKNYQCDCEQIRMVNVTQTFGGTPVFWIRYNPDKFKTMEQHVNITDNQRQAHLLDWLKLAFNRDVQQLAEVVYLFYDGCSKKTLTSEIKNLPMM